MQQSSLSHASLDLASNTLPFTPLPNPTTGSSLKSEVNSTRHMTCHSLRSAHPREGRLEARHSQQRLGRQAARANTANHRAQAACKLTYLAAAHISSRCTALGRQDAATLAAS